MYVRASFEQRPSNSANAVERYSPMWIVDTSGSVIELARAEPQNETLGLGINAAVRGMQVRSVNCRDRTAICGSHMIELR